jgi:hypothetical protein
MKVVLDLPGKRRVAFFARHANRLTDGIINLNDGNPLHRIAVERTE